MKTTSVYSASGVSLCLAAQLSLCCILSFLVTARAEPPKNAVVATVSVGASPGRPVCSPNNDFVYLPISGGIAVIDVAKNQLYTNFSVPGVNNYFLAASPLAISRDGQTLYASVSGGVSVISTANYSVIKTIPIDADGPIEVTPDGTQLWVCSSELESDPSSGGIYIVDTATNSVIGEPIAVAEAAANALVFTRDSRYSYALFFSFSTITSSLVKIDVSTEQVIDSDVAYRALHGSSKGPPREPTYLSINPKGTKLYVYETFTRFWLDAVTVSTDKAVRISSTGPAGSLCQTITPNGKYLYYVHGASPSTNGKVTSISTENGEVTGETATAGLLASSIAILPDGKYAYVANSGEGSVTVIAIE
jgi:DNA-binding beta-propeller fold protein YncE